MVYMGNKEDVKTSPEDNTILGCFHPRQGQPAQRTLELANQLPQPLASFVISWMDDFFFSGVVPLAMRVITNYHCFFVGVEVSGSVPTALSVRVITNQRMYKRLAWSPPASEC